MFRGWAKQKPAQIDRVIVNMREALLLRKSDAITVCESLLDTVTGQKVKETVKLILDFVN